MVASFTNNALMCQKQDGQNLLVAIYFQIVNIIMIVHSSICLYKSGNYYT